MEKIPQKIEDELNEMFNFRLGWFSMELDFYRILREHGFEKYSEFHDAGYRLRVERVEKESS